MVVEETVSQINGSNITLFESENDLFHLYLQVYYCNIGRPFETKENEILRICRQSPML